MHFWLGYDEKQLDWRAEGKKKTPQDVLLTK
jgi:hypothetical protein